MTTTTAVTNMERTRTEETSSAIPRVHGSYGQPPLEYQPEENKHTAIFAIHNFTELPHTRGEKVTTTTVDVVGHSFALVIYPQSKTDADYVAIYFRYEGENTEANPVSVRYQIRTKTKKCAPFESKFSAKTPSKGSGKFKKREDMIRDDLDENGTLTIAVDITIKPEPVEYRQENKQTASFAILNFEELPQQMGEWITTTIVEVKGHPYQLKIYPRGNTASRTGDDYVSIFLIYAGENTATNLNISCEIRTTTVLTDPSAFLQHTLVAPDRRRGMLTVKKREDIIRDDLDENGTLTIEVDITIGTPQRQLEETTNDELDFSSNAPIKIDSGAEVSIVPLAFRLNNEQPTPNGVRVRSCTKHIMVAQAKGELPLNLPKEACTAHKMKCNGPLLSLREAVKHGCVVVLGYGENNDAIIYDQNNIEITVTGPPLVTGTIGRGGSWYVSDYAIPSVDPLTEQQQPSPPASSSSSMLDLLPQGLRFDIYNMLSNKNKMVIFIVVVVLVLVARTGADANTAGAVKACRSLDTIF